MSKARVKKWQDPPKAAPSLHPLMEAVAKRPGEWALVQTLKAGEIAEFHDDCVNHPHFELTVVPQDPENQYECPWDVYIRYIPEHDHSEIEE
jgi:hypothetical protein